LEEFSVRQNKFSRLIQKELSEIFLKEGKSLFPGAMVTITVVRVSPSLDYAKVYLSVFTNGNKDEFLENITLKSKHIRYLLGKKIRNQIKKIPELVFLIDDSLDHIDNINKLLYPEK